MAKKHIKIGVSALLSVLSLASCGNPVTPNETYLVTFTGANGETINLAADDIYGKYITDKASVAQFYNALVEVVIRNEMEKEENASKKATIMSQAESRVKGEEEKARSNANANGTKYDAEWETILESYGSEDREDLKDHFAYELMQERVKEDWFSDAKLGELFETENDDEDYLSKRVPYHVKHILVKVSAAGNGDFVNAEITESEATRLTDTVRLLVEGRNTFGNVALTMSDDNEGETSSQRLNGDLGIMDKKTGYVPEFKLGLYSYDAVYAQTANADRLGISDEIVNSFGAMGLGQIGEIPYGSILKLRDVANQTLNSSGGIVNEGRAFYYPRNVLFNKYFNRHNVSVITPNDVTIPSFAADGTLSGAEDFVGTQNAAYLTNPNARWADVQIGGVTKKVLVDEKGHVILVTRAGASSYQGIHFIVVERSALQDSANGTTLAEYFTFHLPDENNKNNGYPWDEITNTPKATFVNAIGGDMTLLKNRADTIKNAIKGYDANIDYRMFRELFDSQNVKINDPALEASVQKYLASLESNDDYNNAKEFNDSWKQYLEMLQRQQEVRTPDRLLSETCAINFLNSGTVSGYTQPTGACYYVKK
ncbi:MAG: hypothetical protein LBR37_02270 [Erysipelotrichaceae bacterium]|jgi:hypothetical protein|nr:hypothetical protein [Erysipelotrichaceae bacterium]